MKIKEISVVQIDFPAVKEEARSGRRPWGETAEVANPVSRYPKLKPHRSLWRPKWEPSWCKVTAEDGTWGLGKLTFTSPGVPVVEHLAQHLVGEDCMAIEKLADLMFRLTKPYGSVGLASYAISAIDLALWDLKGKLLGQPVYSLIGGPQQDKIFCYCTGNDVDWYMEEGFRAFKLACPYGPADGLDGLFKNEEFVAKARETIGDDKELMLDCWMALDVDYTVRLAEILRPYRVKWLEECLIPEDFDGHIRLRQRLPWQTLTTGEHWYTHFPFQWAIQNKVVDILQPDIAWCGGITTCRRIHDAADAAGIHVILHAGGTTVYGQHFSYAMPSVPWLECVVSAPPGAQGRLQIPGQAQPSNGWLVPNDAPGFGLEVSESELRPISKPVSE